MDCSCIEWMAYASLLYVSFRLSSWALSLLYRRYLATPLDPTTAGKWALVTGSTDGIGKAFAFYLAKKGMNIVLVSRSPYKLQNVAAELERKFKVKTKIIDVDFTTDDKVYLKRLQSELGDMKIGVLVNNVGMMASYPDYFLNHGTDPKVNAELEDDLDRGMDIPRNLVSCNITSMNAMTRLVMPSMVSRGKGIVINIGSLTGWMPCPMLGIYSGTKAYVHKFSLALEYENRSKGITVMCLTPGAVCSNMSGRKVPTPDCPSAEDYVKSAMGRLGIDVVTTGYKGHDVLLWMTECLFPERLQKWIMLKAMTKAQKKHMEMMKEQ